MKSNETDLHIHSIYSDGTLKPKELLEIALSKGLKCISIVDHNAIGGSKELIEIAKDKKITVISGVELDTVYNSNNYHILGYDFDINNEDFKLFVKETNRIKELINIELIKKLQLDFPDMISFQEYLEYGYNKKEGYWKALHYLKHKGLTNSLIDGKEFYKKYGLIEMNKDLPSIKESCEQIHKAGGIAVLAHPGKTIKVNFKTELEKIIKCKIDGIECYYPAHSEEIVKMCLNMCEQYNLFITAGSDFHREFGSREIGENNIIIGNIFTR